MNWARLSNGRSSVLAQLLNKVRLSSASPNPTHKIKRHRTMAQYLVPILLFFLLITPACSIRQFFPGTSGGDSGMTTLGLVINDKYQPVVNAAVGENQLLTDRNGVVTGVLDPNPAGLIPVKAAGYVTGYGVGNQISDHYQVMIVQISSIDTLVPLTNSQQAVVTLGDPEAPALQAEVPGINTTEEGTTLQITEINPLNMPERWLADNSDEINLEYSFSISALDRWGEPLPVGTPSEIKIANSDRDPSQLVLAYFDTDQGKWIEIPNGCSRSDPKYLSCILPHFSYFGLFGSSSGSGASGVGGSDMGGGGFGSGGLDMGIGAPGSGGLDTGENSASSAAWEAYYKAKAKLGEIYKKADQTGEMPDEETLRKAIEDLQKAAEDLANNSSPEVGKNVLADAAADAMTAGQSAAANAMLDGARDIIKDIAEDLLEDDDCGKLSELTHTASQAMGIGGLSNIANQLLDKIKNRQEKCEIWKGTIHYSFFLDSTWTNNPKWEFYSGSSAWMEVHQVTIAIDPESGAVDGDSIVTLNMPDAEYRYTEVSDCGPVHNHQHMETGGGSGSAVLSFEGSYLGGVFSIGPMEVFTSTPVNMQHHSYYALTYAPAPPPNCVPWPNKDISRTQIAEYTSQLIHGFFGAPEPPSLQTMLNSGSRSQAMGMEVIRGTQDLSYAIGTNQSPLIPISRGMVTWNFIQVNKAGD